MASNSAYARTPPYKNLYSPNRPPALVSWLIPEYRTHTGITSLVRSLQSNPPHRPNNDNDKNNASTTTTTTTYPITRHTWCVTPLPSFPFPFPFLFFPSLLPSLTLTSPIIHAPPRSTASPLDPSNNKKRTSFCLHQRRRRRSTTLGARYTVHGTPISQHGAESSQVQSQAPSSEASRPGTRGKVWGKKKSKLR